jgi:hypothetical protein
VSQIANSASSSNRRRARCAMRGLLWTGSLVVRRGTSLLSPFPSLFPFFPPPILLLINRVSRVGYVEFVELESVQKALTLSGTKLLGIPIQVQYTEAEKNRQARNPDAAGAGGSGGPMTGGCVLPSTCFPYLQKRVLIVVMTLSQPLRRLAQLCVDVGRHSGSLPAFRRTRDR